MAITCEQIPKDERNHLRRCIETYKSNGRSMVPIKIKDWYAIIETALLSDEYAVLDVEDKSKFEKRETIPVIPETKGPKREALFS